MGETKYEYMRKGSTYKILQDANVIASCICQLAPYNPYSKLKGSTRSFAVSTPRHVEDNALKAFTLELKAPFTDFQMCF